MPHVSAVITNLAQELTLVDRMQDALSGEMVRRQELLREAGNFASIRDYEKARAAGEDLAPMPSLFIVVDEFSEMLSAKPEFIDLFVAIGRLGRSLGLHLLLASQRLEEGRLRGLESHLSYRVGLRTFSAAESRSVLGVPDAYELPADPGLGYLKPDPSTMLRFKAAYVSGPPAGQVRVRRDEGGHVRGILPFTISEVQSLDLPEPDARAGRRRARRRASSESLLDDRRAPHGRARARRPPGLAAAARRARHPRRPAGRPHRRPPARPGLRRSGAASAGSSCPLGTVDRPREQRRDTLTVDLSGAGGHVAVVGGPRSGKSTLLRTIVASMSLTTRRRSRSSSCSTSAAARSRRSPTCRTSPASAPAPSPTSYAGSSPRCSGIVDRREAYFRANGHRLDRDLPLPARRRAAPTTGTATSSSSSTAGARCARTSTTSRPRSSSSRPAA